MCSISTLAGSPYLRSRSEPCKHTCAKSEDLLSVTKQANMVTVPDLQTPFTVGLAGMAAIFVAALGSQPTLVMTQNKTGRGPKAEKSYHWWGHYTLARRGEPPRSPVLSLVRIPGRQLHQMGQAE